MKILLVIDSLRSGGAQRLFANLARELVRNSHSVDVFERPMLASKRKMAVGTKRARRTAGICAFLIA